MVICRLPEEVNLLIWQLVYCILNIVSDLVVCHVVFEVVYSLVRCHDLEFFYLKPSPDKYRLHGFFDVRRESLLIDVFEVDGVESMKG